MLLASSTQELYAGLLVGEGRFLAEVQRMRGEGEPGNTLVDGQGYWAVDG